MSTPYNQSLPMQPTDLRTDPLGNPVRRGDTVTNVDMAGNPIPVEYHDIPKHGGYLIPPGLAKQAERQAEAANQPTTTDFIAQDVAKVPEFPPNSPALVPLFKLPFMRRAEAMDSFGEIQKIDFAKGGENNEVGPSDAANMYRGLAKMSEFLRSVAVDQAEYDVWAENDGLNESTFTQLWSAYQARMQPGEASSSSS